MKMNDTKNETLKLGGVHMNKFAMLEWNAWKDVCAMLQTVGAVTDEDVQSSIRERDAHGKVLLAMIRTWGDLLAELKIEEELAKRNREALK